MDSWFIYTVVLCTFIKFWQILWNTWNSQNTWRFCQSDQVFKQFSFDDHDFVLF